MSAWYELKPVDTLFFRGSEPMEAGLLAPSTLFPPPVSVIEGAIRTAVLSEQQLPLSEFGSPGHRLEDKIGVKGGPAPFQVCGIILKKKNVVFIPAPWSWFVDQPSKSQSKIDVTRSMNRNLPGMPIDPTVATNLGLATHKGLPLFVQAEHEAQSMGGKWLALDQFRRGINACEPVSGSEFYDMEERIGIALDQQRRTVQGKMYFASHIRLKPDVSIMIGIDRDAGLRDKGLMQLGGEGRLVEYRKTNFSLERQDGSQWMSLAPIPATSEVVRHVIATNKLQITAGWDLSVGFHKPTASWIPAGSVFEKQMHSAMIAIQ